MDLQHLWTESQGLGEFETLEKAIDITDFYKHVEWEVMAVPAKKKNKYYRAAKSLIQISPLILPSGQWKICFECIQTRHEYWQVSV